MGFLWMGKCPAEKCKAEAKQGRRSHLRGVTWLGGAGEAQSPCPADKAHTLCQAEDLVCRALNVLILFGIRNYSLAACWAGRNVILLPLPFYQCTITPWICNCLGFCLRNPDANPSDPRGELLLILGHFSWLSNKLIPVMATRGTYVWREKSCSCLCGDVYLCWQGPSRCYSNPSQPLTREMRQLKNSHREKSATFISKNGCVVLGQRGWNGLKLHQGKFRLDIMKSFVTGILIKHCNKGCGRILFQKTRRGILWYVVIDKKEWF